MPNVSELQRLEEERQVLRANLKEWRYRDKPTKTRLLRELREVERALGVESLPYNSDTF